MIIGSDQTKDHKPKAQPNNQNTKIVLGKGEMKVWLLLGCVNHLLIKMFVRRRI